MKQLPDGITLMDGESRAAEHPSTFLIPSRQDRENLQLGQSVKVCFESATPAGPSAGRFEGAKAERLWLTITAIGMIDRDRFYVGRLTNKPVFLPLSFGDEVTFGPRNIISIEEVFVSGEDVHRGRH